MKNSILLLSIALCGTVYGMNQPLQKDIFALSDEIRITLRYLASDSDEKEKVKEGSCGATTEMPYGIVKKYSVLKNALSFSNESNDGNYEIPILTNSITKEQLENLFLLHAEVLSHASQQERSDVLYKRCTKKGLADVLYVANYLGGKTLYRVATAVAATKLESLALSKKSFAKVASFLKLLTNTDYEYDIFLHLCNKAHYGHEIYATPQSNVLLEGHKNFIYSLCFSPDGTRLASGGDDDTVYVWDVGTGQCKITFKGHAGYINSVCFSPDGKKLASGGFDRMVRIWNVDVGQCATILRGNRDIIKSVCFSPDGTKLASSGYDKTVRLWDVGTGQCKATFEGHAACILSVCFSPDGTRLVSSGYDRMVRLWNVGTGQCAAVLEGHAGTIYSLCFSPSGAKLLFGSDDTLRFLDVGTGRCEATFEGHVDVVSSVCFSPDGTRLVSGGYDKTVRLWDVDTEQCVEILKEHENSINSVCFSPDGIKLAFAGKNRAINLTTLHGLKENFNLASLLLLEFLLHNRKNSELNRSVIEQYRELFMSLPRAFQEKFGDKWVYGEKIA